MRGIEIKPKIEIRKEKEGKPEKIIKEVPEKRKESYREIISGKLRKLTEMIERAILERILTNPDALATEKNFEKLNNRLAIEAEVLTKRYNIEDEVDEKGKVKRGSEKILEAIGYNYNEKKKYEGARKGDLNFYERNALFKMWNLPAEEKDIKEFKEKIGEKIDKLAETKKIKKEEIEKAVHFEEIDYKDTTKEDILFLEYATHFDLNRLEINKTGEIELPPFLFLESPKSKWLKTAFAVGMPTLLLFSLYPNALSPGKEKPVSLKDLEKNPGLMDKVYNEVIFKKIAPHEFAVVKLNATSEPAIEGLVLPAYNYAAPINLNYHYDIPSFWIGAAPGPGFYEEMNKIGLHIDYKNSDIPLPFYLGHRDEVDKIITKYYGIPPEEMKKMDTLIKMTELTEKIKDVPVLSWDNFTVGEDTPENVKKIDNFRELLKEADSGAIPAYDSNFTASIDELFQKEGYNETKLKEIAEKNPKEVINEIARVIDKNVKYDYEKLKAIEKNSRGEPLSRYESSLLNLRTPAETLKMGKGVCEDISDVVTATVEYMKSKEILPQNLLVIRSLSKFIDHSFNSVYTVDSSGRLVDTSIDVTWFDPEKIAEFPEAYDLNAVDYLHTLGLSPDKIAKILLAKFSEYSKLIQDITTYDPWLHKKESEIKINDKG